MQEGLGTGIKKVSSSMCADFSAASLKCIIDANYDKSKCQKEFLEYKECRKKERAAMLATRQQGKAW
ncbi:hypothetical protein KFL_001000100 [Klebsormidium nitens]|uniref:CHCH domain-containing protein n=1 Tax=Klebsormidium nitens TaxID=105231 RepID=A0A1Y1I1T5_KLENI|nr:hypothetical protein KFL_001000100 [Klebsormidium nitens]|eukprot:GAQ82088.1 hypothetical protein KFL_001000100 [Klebsormidium nitens]